MPVYVNLRLLKEGPQQLEGELPNIEFASDLRDELVRFSGPLEYSLAVERQPDGLLITGSLAIQIQCECARCLKAFSQALELPDFSVLAPLSGEEAIPIEGDFGDLTPLLREDIYLGLPTNPLCNPDCRGLPEKASARDLRLEEASSEGPSPWAALDQLKL